MRDRRAIEFDPILKHEARSGCADRAVVGGLDRLIDRLLAQGDERARAMRSSLPDGGYRSLTRAERDAWVRRTLDPGVEPGDTIAPAMRADAGNGVRGTADDDDPPAALQSASGDDPLDTPLELSGIRIGDRQRVRLRDLGLDTVGDLLRHYPYRHHDFTRAVPIANVRAGEEQAVIGTLSRIYVARVGRRMAAQAVIEDKSGNIRVTWFNMPFLTRELRVGQRVALSGKVRFYGRSLSMANPQYMVLGDDGSGVALMPLYRTTRGLSADALRVIVAGALDRYGDCVKESVPADLRDRHGLITSADAVPQMHYPKSFAMRELARRTTAFTELLAVQLCVVKRQRVRETDISAPRIRADETTDAFVAALPFELTGAQRRALDTVLDDLDSPSPMGRLLQGDVGSGKTVVALAAMLATVAAGKQAVIMAPTEVLAAQHFRTLSALLGGGGQAVPGAALLNYPPHRVDITLLTGSTPARTRRYRIEMIRNGGADIVVGTHSLIQKDVEFHDLGLAVVDEQHRFGVMQRAAIREGKGRGGGGAHLLVMTATPIPRSLALTLYGDLDISVIDELPPSRKPVRTRWLRPHERDEAFETVRTEVAAGRQAFVICPLVDGSSAVQSRSAKAEHERLRTEEFADWPDRVELLHGRMPAKAKEAAMRRFVSGDASVLVSTAVVEVGVDVPNATVMIIEGAGRFGVAQMHQFRGRVGRGEHQSACFLLEDDPTEDAEERLSMVERSTNGFDLAQADLELRGPGNLFGVEQAGRGLHATALLDSALIEASRAEAEALLDVDPELGLPAHGELRRLANAAAKGIIAEAH